MAFRKFKTPAPVNVEVAKDAPITLEAKEVVTKLGFFDKWKLKRAPDRSFFITMFFSNGTEKTWVIKTKSETFEFRKKAYFLKYENAYYDLTNKNYHLYFNEDFAVPINRAILKDGDEAWFSVTPEALKPLLKMEFLKNLVNSGEISKILKACLVVGIAGAAAAIGHLVMFIQFTKQAAGK